MSSSSSFFPEAAQEEQEAAIASRIQLHNQEPQKSTSINMYSKLKKTPFSFVDAKEVCEVGQMASMQN